MENGNIMEFVKAHREFNRLRLVSEGSVITSVLTILDSSLTR